jgi:2-polyprenyl-3-methyl-5-hydroxy-6-metoxy-1,4-benzoquinol methylase
MMMQELMIDESQLTLSEGAELRRLLALSQTMPPTLTDLWHMMDTVWTETGCDAEQLQGDRMRQKMDQFYAHPIWLLNGLFVEQDAESRGQRQAIAQWLQQHSDIQTLLDYGGGFGTLARCIADACPHVHVHIFEPHPHRMARQKIAAYPMVRFIEIPDETYDCLVSTDVLEHVPDPLRTFAEMIDHVRLGGYLVIANCFHPVIACHLPCTFHLRYTFDQFAQLMGLEKVEPCAGSSATVYRKARQQPWNWTVLRRWESASKLLYGVVGPVRYVSRRSRGLKG